MTKTCLQCGAVLPSSADACNFCDSSFSVDFSSSEALLSENSSDDSLMIQKPLKVPAESSHRDANFAAETRESNAWRGELAERLEAYRKRRRKVAPNAAQTHFSFDESPQPAPASPAIAVEQRLPPENEDFSFTIAIGRPAKKPILEESRMVIDVSLGPETETGAPAQQLAVENNVSSELHPVAPIEERRLAGLIDLCCLLFAYGGFLALFGSLGGQFTLSKLSAAVYVTTLAIVYLQFFFLFTVFGGTTPGMMLRGLQVLSLGGEPPTPKQMLLRTVGYVLSAATFFLGFLWSMWDEDELTWHDRLSNTYLSKTETFGDLENSTAAHS